MSKIFVNLLYLQPVRKEMRLNSKSNSLCRRSTRLTILIYKVIIWYSLQSERQRDKKITLKNFTIRMTSIQNNCLQIMSDIYHIILISVLKIEIFTLSLDLYLNMKLTQFWLKYKKSDIKNLIKNACFKIHNKLCKRKCQLQYQSMQIEKEVRTQ